MAIVGKAESCNPFLLLLDGAGISRILAPPQQKEVILKSHHSLGTVRRGMTTLPHHGGAHPNDFEARRDVDVESVRRSVVWLQAGEPRRAKAMEPAQFELALQIARDGNAPESDVLKLLLSFYAGLRAAEITALTFSGVSNADGSVGDRIWIAGSQTKNGKERTIPMHPRIREAIIQLRSVYPDIDYFAFSKLGPLPKRQSVWAVTQWFRRVYAKAGLVGCSSHSGRRSFITQLARRANELQCSLLDVQQLAGHARLDTTQAYIEPSPYVGSLVNSLGEDMIANPRGLI